MNEIIRLAHKMNIRLAIVGSREFTDYDLLCNTMKDFIAKHGMPSSIVSGGARGADTLAERWAKENDVGVIIFKPDWSKGKGAALERNFDIVGNCTHMIAFPSKNSRGTWHSIGIAKQMGINVIEICYDK